MWGRIFLGLVVGVGGCAHPAGRTTSDSTHPPVADELQGEGLLRVPGSDSWTDTGLMLSPGESIAIEACGRIRAAVSKSDAQQVTSWTGASGTYLPPLDHDGHSDPLPTGEHGPAPAFALIGRIGDGPPFLIGSRTSFTSSRRGPLWLGINDHSPSDNLGAFAVKIERCDQPRPAWHEQVIAASRHDASAAPRGSAVRHVVVIYVDGLRPDVFREMALTGHLPALRRVFLDEGTWLENTLTVFPSSTLTANGSMWTGCFPDRHGLTATIRFDRRTSTSRSHLVPLGPLRAGETLASVGLARTTSRAARAVGRQLLSLSTSAPTPESDGPLPATAVPLFSILQDQGTDWATGVLPLMPHLSPPLWSRSLLRHLPWLRADRAWEHIDEANTTYAIRHLFGQRRPVTVIWMPETDSVSHKHGRGQFGSTRRTLARVDQLVAEILEHLRQRQLLDSTVLMLVSDHGHHGGRHGHLYHFDVAHEVFFRTRQVTAQGEWVGGGLGVSVRQHQLHSRHPRDRDSVFVDGLPDGTCRVYLPRGGYTSGRWQGSLRPADLLRYPIAPHLPPINLLQRLIDAGPSDGETRGRPVDLVLVRNTASTLLLVTRDRGAAVITKRPGENGGFEFHYAVVTELHPTAGGSIGFERQENPSVDPLGLIQQLGPRFLAEYHNETAWLSATFDNIYPDAVVSLGRSLLWDSSINQRARREAPDVVLTASPGWYFGRDPTRGTMHGHPLASSMKATWFVSGPGIRRATRVTTPCRLTDLAPTILDMLGRTPAEHRFDGHPVRAIYRSTSSRLIASRPVSWQSVLLTDWSALDYQPRPVAAEVPRTVNHPHSPTDLNTMMHNVVSIPSWSPFRLFDSLLGTTRQQSVTATLEHAEATLRRTGSASLPDAAGIVNLSDLALSDYSPTSAGNLFRLDQLIDGLQRPTQPKASQTATTPVARGARPLHAGIDLLQDLLRGLHGLGQRIAVEAIDDHLATGMERLADLVINSDHRIPAERIISPTDR